MFYTVIIHIVNLHFILICVCVSVCACVEQPLPLVNVLLLWRDTMTQEAYRRKHLTYSLLIVSWSSWWEPWHQAGRHNTAAVAESLYLIHKHNVERVQYCAWCGLLRSQSTLPSNIPPPTRPHLLVLPKQFHQLGSKLKYMTFRDYSYPTYYILGCKERMHGADVEPNSGLLSKQ